MNKALLVVGFNSRPIAKSLHQAGYDAYAIDFFGDWDLPLVTKDFAAVGPILAQKGSQKEQPPESFQSIMLELAAEMMQKYPRITGCILGSGFDDQYRLVEQLNKIVPVYGTSAQGMRTVRDFGWIRKVAQEAGFRNPQIIPARKAQGIQAFTYPCVLTPKHSSGGLSKRLISSQPDLQAHLQITPDQSDDLVIEEYVQGIPMSCTFIKKGDVVQVVAINDQLIGDPHCHPPGPFYYCGNITPSRAPNLIVEKARICCQQLAEILPLEGINGIDFVGTEEGIYFMEVNPRIPGSLAPIELSLNRSIIADIFLYPAQLARKKYTPAFTGIKSILYAPQRIPTGAQIPLRGESSISDIPAGDRPIEQGEPICSVLTRGASPLATWSRTLEIINGIYGKIEKKPKAAA